MPPRRAIDSRRNERRDHPSIVGDLSNFDLCSIDEHLQGAKSYRVLGLNQDPKASVSVWLLIACLTKNGILLPPSDDTYASEFLIVWHSRLANSDVILLKQDRIAIVFRFPLEECRILPRSDSEDRELPSRFDPLHGWNPRK